MRDFLDAILDFIESESLTDDEFSALEITEEEYTLETYNALKAVLEGREGVSGQQTKLKSFFIAKGIDVTASAFVTKSNMLIGIVL